MGLKKIIHHNIVSLTSLPINPGFEENCINRNGDIADNMDFSINKFQ